MTQRTEAAPTLLWSAGEASGDRHAARVVRAIRAVRPDVRSVGLGGPEMAAAGVELLAGMEEVTAVGVTDVLARWRQLLAVRHRLLTRLNGRDGGRRPSLFIPVDFPGLNLRLARRARRAGVPVVYFISPQIWAWGAERMAEIRASVRRMLVLFDFEERMYREAGVPVTLVGHPLVEQTNEAPDRETARRELGLSAGELVLVLMPGSRPGELRRLLQPMLEVARRLCAVHPGLRVLVRVAPGLELEPARAAAASAGVDAQVIGGGDPRPVRAADLALVAVGTATLETALLGTPMLVLYRVSWLTYVIARRLVAIPSIGLVNVVAGRPVVPEFIQERLKLEDVTQAALQLLTDPEAQKVQLRELAAVRSKLGGDGAAARAAAAILAELEATSGSSGESGAMSGETMSGETMKARR